MTHGIYSRLRAIIMEHRANGHLCLETKRLMDTIDTSEVTEEEKDRAYRMQAVLSTAWQLGYRSVQRGAGFLFDVENCDNPIYLQKFVDNTSGDIRKKEIVLEYLQNLKNKCVDSLPDYAQMTLDIDEDGRISCVDGLTAEDLIEMLRRDARMGEAS